jgi:hypothetical protein
LKSQPNNDLQKYQKVKRNFPKTQVSIARVKSLLFPLQFHIGKVFQRHSGGGGDPGVLRELFEKLPAKFLNIIPAEAGIHIVAYILFHFCLHQF